MPASSMGDPPPTLSRANVPAATKRALIMITGVGVVQRSAPVAGQATCVDLSQSVAGRPEAASAICSSQDRSPEIIIRPRSGADRANARRRSARTRLRPHRSASRHGSSPSRRGAGNTLRKGRLAHREHSAEERPVELDGVNDDALVLIPEDPLLACCPLEGRDHTHLVDDAD